MIVNSSAPVLAPRMASPSSYGPRQQQRDVLAASRCCAYRTCSFKQLSHVARQGFFALRICRLRALGPRATPAGRACVD